MKKRNVDKKTNAERGAPSNMRHEMNAWLDFVSPEIDVSNELDAVFNFPRIHMNSPLVEQIPRYKAWQQFSPEGHE
jgi:hypothetical protein